MRSNHVHGFAGKHLPPLTEKNLEILAELESLSLSEFSEDDVREEYLAPLVKLLGYGRGTEYDVRRGEDYKLSPSFVKIGRQRIELDYHFSIYKHGFWLLEAKPAQKENYRPTEEDILQAYYYALHPQVDSPFFAVSNGWWLLVFDRTAEDPLRPILEIGQKELRQKINDLRRILSAEQLTFHLKDKLLKRIEQVLGADCYPERTSQFVESVKRIGDGVGPTVLNNFRLARFGKDEQTGDERSALLNGYSLNLLSRFPLGYCWNLNELEELTSAVLKKLTHSVVDAQFYSELCLEQSRPVAVFHYFNAIYILGKIAEAGNPLTHWMPQDLRDKGYTEVTAHQLFDWIIRLTITRFRQPNRPELRLMWHVEALAGRMAKRLLLYDVERRNQLLQAVNLDQFFQSEKEVAQQNPHAAQKLVLEIERQKRMVTGTFFRQHFDERNRSWNDVLARQTYEHMFAAEKALSDATPDYEEIKKGLGSGWSELMATDYVNTKWDQLGAGICDLSMHFPVLLKQLPEDLKEMYRDLAVARVNYARACCEAMSLEFKECPADEVTAYQYKLCSL